jgi:hypothetical protein
MDDILQSWRSLLVQVPRGGGQYIRQGLPGATDPLPTRWPPGGMPCLAQGWASSEKLIMFYSPGFGQ